MNQTDQQAAATKTNQPTPRPRVARACMPFHVIAKPIGPLCNLECEYCFYLDKIRMFARGTDFRMSEAVLEAHIRQYIDCQPGHCAEVDMVWQGGEPMLMGLDFFQRVIDIQQRHARPGMRIHNALQTNGVLLDDAWCEFLKQHNFLVGISVDGPAAVHDLHRKTHSGRGTFDVVVRAIRCLQKHRVDFNALTVVNRANARRPLEVYRCLRELGVEHMQFIPLVEPGGSGGVTDRSVVPEQYGEFMVAVFNEWRKRDIGRIFVQQFEMALSTLAGSNVTMCVHAPYCGRNVVLEHNGNVYSCDHYVDENHYIGNILKRSYTEIIDYRKQQQFGHDKYERMAETCRGCKVLSLCNGGCPKDQFERDSNDKRRRSYLCAGYKRFFTYITPFLDAMRRSLASGHPASEYTRLMSNHTGRNAPCSCGSGIKFKRCCGKSTGRVIFR